MKIRSSSYASLEGSRYVRTSSLWNLRRLSCHPAVLRPAKNAALPPEAPLRSTGVVRIEQERVVPVAADDEPRRQPWRQSRGCEIVVPCPLQGAAPQAFVVGVRHSGVDDLLGDGVHARHRDPLVTDSESSAAAT